MNTTAFQITTDNELNLLQRKMDAALDTRELINLVFQALEKRIGIVGIHYDNKDQHLHIHAGKTAPHQCNYRLIQAGHNYGSITTFQTHRLDEIAMSRIEALLGMMMQPLQDSLLYQRAMIHSCWDPVTRVNNKTAFRRALNTLREENCNTDKTINAVFIKLDSLNEVYQKFGIENADNMLCHIIDLAHQHCRGKDEIFRFSDEEFVILLPDTSEEQAKLVASRLQELCHNHKEFILGNDSDCHITVDVVKCGKGNNCSNCTHSNSGKCLSQNAFMCASGAA